MKKGYDNINKSKKIKKNTSTSSSSSKKLPRPRKTQKLHYIVVLHGTEILKESYTIPYHKNKKVNMNLYVKSGELMASFIETDMKAICSKSKKVPVVVNKLKSGDVMRNITFSGDDNLNTGLYLCVNKKKGFTKLKSFHTGSHYNLSDIIRIIFHYSSSRYVNMNIEISMINCRTYKERNTDIGVKIGEIQKIDPDVELAEMFSKIDLSKKEEEKLKIWNFTEEDLFNFLPVECGIEKQQQHGCALQTLVFLGELKDRDKVREEVIYASTYKTSTVHRIYEVLYDNAVKEKNKKITIVTKRFELFDDNYNNVKLQHLKNICKELKNNQATLIKLNRKTDIIAHVICLIKYNDECLIIDPQQQKNYNMEKFKSFLMRHKNTNFFGSFDVIYEKVRSKRLRSKSNITNKLKKSSSKSSSSSYSKRKTKKVRMSVSPKKEEESDSGKMDIVNSPPKNNDDEMDLDI